MFLAPVVLLLIGATAATQAGGAIVSGSTSQFAPAFAAWRSPVWRQVRIERRFSIRITPGAASMPPAIIEELEQEERVERLEGHKIGKCLAIAAIAAVQPGDGDELLLFLRDQRIIGVTLEKRCNARAFYSGFYIARGADGAICAGRDILQSRSGVNCKVRRLNELMPAGYRRIP